MKLIKPIVIFTITGLALMAIFSKQLFKPRDENFFTNSDLKLTGARGPELNPKISFPGMPDKPLGGFTPPPLTKKQIQESERLKKEFSNIAKIYIPYPKEMHFMDIDLDPNMLAMAGFNLKTSANLMFIARRGTVSPNEVLPFLKESLGLIPNVTAEVLERFPAPDPLDINPKSGLIDNTLWEIKTEQVTFYFLFANRKDGLGSYLAIFSGHKTGADLISPQIYKMADEIKVSP